MPRGVFRRTAHHKAILRRVVKIAQKASRARSHAEKVRGVQAAQAASRLLPRTRKQILAVRRNLKYANKVARTMPRTAKQLEVSRRTIKLAQKVAHCLPRSKKQLMALKKARKNPSRVQVEFSKHLQKFISGLKFNLPIRARGHEYYPDIVNPKTARIIEVDGVHWHDKKKDKIRDSRLRKAGWKILRLPANRDYLFQKEIVAISVDFLKGKKL